MFEEFSFFVLLVAIFAEPLHTDIPKLYSKYLHSKFRISSVSTRYVLKYTLIYTNNIATRDTTKGSSIKVSITSNSTTVIREQHKNYKKNCNNYEYIINSNLLLPLLHTKSVLRLKINLNHAKNVNSHNDQPR